MAASVLWLRVDMQGICKIERRWFWNHYLEDRRIEKLRWLMRIENSFQRDTWRVYSVHLI